MLKNCKGVVQECGFGTCCALLPQMALSIKLVCIVLAVSISSVFGSGDDFDSEALRKKTVATVTNNSTAYEYYGLKIPDDWLKTLPEDTSFTWFKGETNQSVDNNGRVIVDPKGTLHFLYLLVDDAGTYYANLTSAEHNLVLRAVNLILNVKQASPTSKSQKDQYLSEKSQSLSKGERLELWCIFSGHPLPTIIWTTPPGATKSVRFENGNATMILENVEGADTGDYACTAKSKTSIERTRTFTVKIYTPPNIFQVPTDVAVAVGERTILRCSADGDPPLDIQWIHEGRTVEKTPETNTSSYYTLVGAGRTLIIDNISQRDAGRYVCKVSNNNGSTEAEANVTILPIPPELIRQPQNTHVVEGKSGILSCQVFGAPKPTLVWKKNGLDLADSRYKLLANGDLKIEKAGKDDGGNYSCYVQNQFGELDTVVQLLVYKKTVIFDVPKEYKVIRGGNTTLTCQFRADSAAVTNVYWMKDSRSIGNSTYSRRLNSAYQNTESNTHVLRISNATDSDSGTYYCMIQTHTEPPAVADVVTATTKVIVQDVPYPPELSEPKCKKRSAELEWKSQPPKGSQSPISAYFLQYMSNSGWENISSTIQAPANNSVVNELKPWTTYNFYVFAVSEIGLSPPSASNKKCLTDPDFPDKNPENVSCKRNAEENDPSKISLLLSWTSLSPEDFNSRACFYRIRLKTSFDGNHSDEYNTTDCTIHEHTIRNLPNNGTYFLQLKTFNDVGEAIVDPDYSPVCVNYYPPYSMTVNANGIPISKNEKIHLLRGQPLEVTCSAKGKPLPKITWKFGNKDLSDHLKQRNQSFVSLDNNRLVILSMRKEDSGDYVCSASNNNSIPPLEKSISVNVTDPKPMPVDDLIAHALSNDAVYLLWKRPIRMSGPVAKYEVIAESVNTKAGSQHNATYLFSPDYLEAKLSNLKSGTKYRVRVKTILHSGATADRTIYANTSENWSGRSDLSRPSFKWRWLYGKSAIGAHEPKSTTIRIYWNPNFKLNAGDAPGFGFFVDYRLNGSDVGGTPKFENSKSSVDISQLLPDRSYSFSVRSVRRTHGEKSSDTITLQPSGNYIDDPEMSILTNSSIWLHRFRSLRNPTSQNVSGGNSFSVSTKNSSRTHCLHLNRRVHGIECTVGNETKFPNFPIQGPSSQNISMALSPFGDYLVWKQTSGPLFISNIRSSITIPLLTISNETSFLASDWLGGIVFWVQGTHIFSLKLNGGENLAQTSLVKSPSKEEIVGLTCDPAHELVYWVTRSSLFEVGYDGSGVSLLLTLPVSSVQRDTLNVFQSRVYWVTSVAKGVYALSAFSVTTGELTQELLTLPKEVIYGMRLSEDQTTDPSNGCERCTYFCLPRYRGPVQCIDRILGVSEREMGAEKPKVIFASIRNTTKIKNQEDQVRPPLEVTRLIGNAGFITGVSDYRYCYLQQNESHVTCTSVGGASHSIAFSSTLLDAALSVSLVDENGETHIFAWVLKGSCITRWELKSGTLDTILCRPRIDTNNVIIDGVHGIVFWRSIQDEVVYKTDLVSGEEKQMISKENFHSTAGAPYRLTCDPDSRTLYWLSTTSLHKMDYEGTRMITTSSFTSTAHSLILVEGLLFWIESETNANIIVVFNPILGRRHAIYQVNSTTSLSHLSVGFGGTRTNQAKTECQKNCSHFCRQSDSACFCPLERPILVRGTTCIEPELIIAEISTVGSNLGQIQLSQKGKVITKVSDSARMKESPVPETVFAVNGPTNRTCWSSDTESANLTCSPVFSETFARSNGSRTPTFLTISQDGSTIFWNGRAKDCVDMQRSDGNILHTICYNIPERSPTAIDSSRKLAFWCYNRLGYSYLGYRSLDNKVRPAQIPLTNRNQCSNDVGTCTSVTVDEFKGQAFVIHGQTIKRIDYLNLITLDKPPTIIHHISYKFAHSLEYYMDNLFWVGGVADYGEFVDTIRVPPQGQSFIVGSRRYLDERAMKAKNPILQLQIQKHHSEEYTWINPCIVDSKCHYFCFPSDPPGEKTTNTAPSSTCYCPSSPTLPEGKASCESLEKLFLNQPTQVSSEIIVSIVAVVVLVVLAIVLVVVIFLQKKKRIADLEALKEEFMNGNEAAVAAARTGTEIAINKGFSDIIPPQDIKIFKDKILGSGAFGMVYEGEYRGHRVAAKSVKPGSPSNVIGDFMKEVKVTAYLGHHQNVVHFYGAEISELDSGIVYAALEFSPYGSLENRLVKMDSGANSDLPIDKLLRWSYEVANGMEYLVHRKVVHGDLAARNVLVFENEVVKISDFGFSRNMYGNNQYVKKETCPIPFRWAAPETLERLEFSHKADVWSYGVVVWEIFSLGQCPFAKYDWDESFAGTLRDGLKHPKPRHSSQEIYDRVMMPCWQWKPDSRPSFGEIKQVINEISPTAATNVSAPSTGLTNVSEPSTSNHYVIK